MSELFFKLLSELEGVSLKKETVPGQKKSACNILSRYDDIRNLEGKHAEQTEEDELINLDLGLDLDDIPNLRKRKEVSPDSDLPDLSYFWPGKTAQYWIPSDDNQNGKHLVLDLTFALLGRHDIAPSNTVPLLFYHDIRGEKACVLCFKNNEDPFVRKCEKSIENELYSKSLEEHRILLIPTANIPKDKLLVLLPPVSNIGVLEKTNEISWVFNYISNDHERCVFFEEGNSPNTLRQSIVLREIARGGLLYIVMCAGDLVIAPNIKTDINSPKKAGKKMFRKQLSMLCPGTWNRFLCDPEKKDIGVFIKELFRPINESGIYHLKKTQISPQISCNLVPFSENITSSVTFELKSIYLEHLPDFIRTIKERIPFDKNALSDSITSSLTRICHEAYVRKKEAFPKMEKTRTTMRASLFFLIFRTATRITSNFIQEITLLESKLLSSPTYDAGKKYLWNYFPDFNSICRKDLQQLQDKSLILQTAFTEITARENEDNNNERF